MRGSSPRRFLVRNTAGDTVGEGVLWADDLVTYRLGNSEPKTFDLKRYRTPGVLPDKLHELEGNPVEWLDRTEDHLYDYWEHFPNGDPLGLGTGFEYREADGSEINL
jgi:hypothetical protein